MQPILFWTLGVGSLVAAGVAVLSAKPLRCLMALLALMGINSLIFLLLSASVLALELVVLTTGAFSLAWFVLVRPGRMRLGMPGRKRFGLGMFVALWIVGWLGRGVLDVLKISPDPLINCWQTRQGIGDLWIGVAISVGMVAIVTCYVIVSVWRQEEPAGGRSP